MVLARAILRSARVRLEPEDLVQIVLAEIYQKVQAGRQIDNPRAYANMALKNRALDEIRRFHNKYEHAWPTDSEGEQSWEPPDANSVAADLDPAIRDVLMHLDEQERCFLWRVVFEQRSVHEAQEMCGWPEKSPYFHYRKLLDRLRPLMGVDQ